MLLEGTGRIRVDQDLLTMTALSGVLVEPAPVWQLFNDTDVERVWLVFGAPREAASTLEKAPEQLGRHYPDGPKALPPELDG